MTVPVPALTTGFFFRAGSSLLVTGGNLALGADGGAAAGAGHPAVGDGAAVGPAAGTGAAEVDALGEPEAVVFFAGEPLSATISTTTPTIARTPRPAPSPALRRLRAIAAARAASWPARLRSFFAERRASAGVGLRVDVPGFGELLSTCLIS